MSEPACPLATRGLKYSGVPNAGAPDFMSTLDVNAPYMTGAPAARPGSGDARSRPLRVQRERTGERHRAIAPASVNGVTTES
jgi:hypothetical protein